MTAWARRMMFCTGLSLCGLLISGCEGNGPSGSGVLTGTWKGNTGWAWSDVGFIMVHKQVWKISHDGATVTVTSENEDGTGDSATWQATYDEATNRLTTKGRYYQVSDDHNSISAVGNGAYGLMVRD